MTRRLRMLQQGPELEAALARNVARLDELRYLMYAERRHALLVCSSDGCGKDGTIRWRFSTASAFAPGALDEHSAMIKEDQRAEDGRNPSRS